MSLGIMTLGIMTLGIMTLGIMTLGTMTICIITLVLEQYFKRHPTTKFNKTPSANIFFCK